MHDGGRQARKMVVAAGQDGCRGFPVAGTGALGATAVNNLGATKGARH